MHSEGVQLVHTCQSRHASQLRAWLRTPPMERRDAAYVAQRLETILEIELTVFVRASVVCTTRE